MARGLTVKSACESCGSTGLYSGMCEKSGQAVVCLDCDGTGCCVIEYKAFMGRQRRYDIKKVIVGRQSKSILEGNKGKNEIDYDKWWDKTSR